MTDKHPGRPPLGDENMRRINVSLDENTIKVAKAYGNGNLSAGIRKLAQIGYLVTLGYDDLNAQPHTAPHTPENST